MSRQFVYFEATEGGMETHELSDPLRLKFLYGWMSDSCKEEDTNLLRWAETAEIGEMKDHRLGTLVRLKDS